MQISDCEDGDYKEKNFYIVCSTRRINNINGLLDFILRKYVIISLQKHLMH